MTAPVFRPSFEKTIKDVHDRVKILEAVPASTSPSTGIQFDTDNQGGYLDITSNSLDADGHGIFIVNTVGDNTHNSPPFSDVVFGYPISGTGLAGDSGRVIFGLPFGANSSWDFVRKASAGSATRYIILSIAKNGAITMNTHAEGGGQIFNAASVQAMASDLDAADTPLRSTFLGGMAAGPPTSVTAYTGVVRDFVVDSKGDIWVCVVAGTPGTWKRVRPYNSGTTTSSATPTINTDRTDVYEITALAANITSFTTNLTGTPITGQRLHIAITDNGTFRTIAWGASFEASTVALPTVTVVSTRLDVDFIWNPATSKWRCLQAV